MVLENIKYPKSVKFLYETLIGRIILKILTRPFISKIMGLFMDSSFSKFYIKKFIEKNNIDMSVYEEKEYKSYNDFFTRKMKEEFFTFRLDESTLPSPCSSKVSVYKINENSVFEIKNSKYSVETLLQSKSLARKYENGYIFICRMTEDDYHRYSFIDDGEKDEDVFIKGVLHTVQPIALNHYNIYKMNSRSYSLLHTKNFGDVIQMEVGALMIGRINNYNLKTFKRGDEKGMFEFGGSTVVLLFEENKITPLPELIETTNKGAETIIQIGEKIGIKFN